jgi:hypothetical protein
MSLKRTTAVTLATAAMTLGSAAPSLAMPARDAGVASAPTPVILAAASPSTTDGGTGTLAVVLLGTGALLAGAGAGFGGARVAASRKPLHPH